MADDPELTRLIAAIARGLAIEEEVLAKNLDSDVVEELGFDSLQMLELLLVVEEELATPMPDDIFDHARTLRGLHQVFRIESRVRGIDVAGPHR